MKVKNLLCYFSIEYKKRGGEKIMKKIDNFIKQLDLFVDKYFQAIIQFTKQYFIAISITTLTALVFITITRLLLHKPQAYVTNIGEDLKELSLILSQIDKECNILSITNNQGVINFLTVERFAGSQIGCFNLAYPSKWQGPYVTRNPSILGKFYEIIKTAEGVFILPGKGVELPSREILGVTLLIDPNVSIVSMMQEGGPLNYEGHSLALKLDFIIGDWDSSVLSSAELKNIKSDIDKFSKAIPVT